MWGTFVELRAPISPLTRSMVESWRVKSVPLVLGVVMLVVGGVFTFQGLGYLEGSPMTGVEFWAVVGPVIAGLGVSLIIVSLQNKGRRR